MTEDQIDIHEFVEDLDFAIYNIQQQLEKLRDKVDTMRAQVTDK